MSAGRPDGWDDKSWADVCASSDKLRSLLASLTAAMASEDVSAERIEALFEEAATVCDVGALAASWCKG